MNSQLSATLRDQIRNRPAKLAGENIRNYPQPAWPVSATAENYRVARREAIFLFSESSDNHPTKRRNHPMESASRPIIGRRNLRIDRSGSRHESVESSDNRQMIHGNCQIAPFLDRPIGPPNRKLIVNRFPVIVNFAASDLSTIHQLARRQPRFRFFELSYNHPTDSSNLPIIYRRIPGIYRSGQENKLHAQNFRR